MVRRLRGRSMKGSLTVEMAFLMPLILFLMMGCIFAVFYYHDKNILAGAAYETAVVGSTKAREKEGVKPGQLEELLGERIRGKCIFFANPSGSVTVTEHEITVTIQASKQSMSISVVKRAAVTDPEAYIRDMRRIGK